MNVIKSNTSPTLPPKPMYLSGVVKAVFAVPPAISLLEVLIRIIFLPFAYALGISSLDFSTTKLISISFSVALFTLLWLQIRGKKVSIPMVFVILSAIVFDVKEIATCYAMSGLSCVLFFMTEEYIPTFNQWNLFKRLAALAVFMPLGAILGTMITMIVWR